MQGKVKGNKPALWLRSKLQEELYNLGLFIENHAEKILFLGILVLLAFGVGLKSARMEHKVENLWIEGKTSRVPKVGDAAGFPVWSEK